MSAYLQNGVWRYRVSVKLKSGGSVRISGTPDVSSRHHALAAEQQHISEVLEEDELGPPLDALQHEIVPTVPGGFSKNHKGDVAEACVLAELLRVGYAVSVPWNVKRYDLVLELPDGKLKKVQVKAARIEGNCLAFHPYSISHATKDRKAVHRPYDKDEVDYFAVYSPDLHKSFLVPNTQNISGRLLLGDYRGEKEYDSQRALNFEVTRSSSFPNFSLAAKEVIERAKTRAAEKRACVAEAVMIDETAPTADVAEW